jgi:hypothetical protein
VRVVTPVLFGKCGVQRTSVVMVAAICMQKPLEEDEHIRLNWPTGACCYACIVWEMRFTKDFCSDGRSNACTSRWRRTSTYDSTGQQVRVVTPVMFGKCGLQRTCVLIFAAMHAQAA